MREQIFGKAFLLLLAVLFLFSSCATSERDNHTRMLTAARGVTNPAGVKVYSVAPRKNYTAIAIVEGRTPEEMRIRAAAVGANGVILGDIVRRRGPVIGVGVGTSNLDYGRHGATYVGSGASFAIPTGGSYVQGTAIYVP